MRYQTIHFEKREANQSPHALKKLRRSGRLPAVLSRAGEHPLEISTPRRELAEAVRQTGLGGVMLLVNEAEGAEHLGILKELQWHPLSRELLHAAFQGVDSSQVVNTRVPISLHGQPDAVTRKSAQLLKQHESIEVHAKVTDLPQQIAIEIGGLQVGDTVTAGDVVLPRGCEAANPNEVLFQVAPAFEQVIEEPAAAAADGAAEPELVGKKSEDDGGSSE